MFMRVMIVIPWSGREDEKWRNHRIYGVLEYVEVKSSEMTKRGKGSIEEGADRTLAEPWPHLRQKWILLLVNSNRDRGSNNRRRIEDDRDRGGRRPEDPILLIGIIFYYYIIILSRNLSF